MSPLTPGRIRILEEYTMASPSLKTVVAGTPSGYIIRWTCPACSAENTIVNRSPGEFFKPARDATCRTCRKRSTISTPGFHK